jgi:simple sugar transport system permease protein
VNLVDLLTQTTVATLIVAAPLMFAAIGELISESGGVLNLGLEAMMLVGAMCGFVGGEITGNILGAVIGALLGGVVVAAIHGVTCFVFRADQVVSGLALNILALGVTTLFVTVGFQGTPLSSVSLPRIDLGPLSDIPFVGPVFLHQNYAVYLAFALVPITAWLLTRTRPGLALRAAGESPRAAEALGVDVTLVRWAGLLACGVLAGIGGGILSVVNLGYLTTNITAGRGFIALAAVVLGSWRPLRVMAGILLFSFADAIQVRAQVLGIPLPYQLLVALPYLVTLIALAAGWRSRAAPSDLGRNFFRT